MLLDALVGLATNTAGEESAPTAFYVAGGALAAWAVLVSLAGLAGRASFAGSTVARNGVMGVSAALVLAAVASAILSG